MAPLYFLFRATAARSDRFRRQLVGVVIAAPIFFAIAAIFTGIVTDSAADKYVNGEAKATMTPKEATERMPERTAGQGQEGLRQRMGRRARKAKRRRSSAKRRNSKTTRPSTR